MRAVIAKSYARIHAQNLANFGILPLLFSDPADYDRVQPNDALVIENAREAVQQGSGIQVRNQTRDETYETHHRLYPRQVEMVLEGSLINVVRRESGA